MDRYVVREGTSGWMVWDRDLKGPAIILDRTLVRLSEVEAYRTLRQLTDIHGDKEKRDEAPTP